MSYDPDREGQRCNSFAYCRLSEDGRATLEHAPTGCGALVNLQESGLLVYNPLGNDLSPQGWCYLAFDARLAFPDEAEVPVLSIHVLVLGGVPREPVNQAI